VRPSAFQPQALDELQTAAVQAFANGFDSLLERAKKE
jgi:hypothetical protein